MLIPGFLAGDGSLATMTHWLRQNGYHTRRAGIRANVGCSEEACARLEARLEGFAEHTGQKVSIVGQSRGGVFARALAVRRPDLVEGIVTLGSPTVSQLRIHPLVLAQVGLVSALGTARVPGLFSLALPARRLLPGVPRRRSPARSRTRSATWRCTRARDGVVDWHSCLDEAAQLVEVGASHCGMSVSAQVYRELGFALGAFGAADARLGPGRLAEPRAIAASIAAPGDSTTLPWPGASRVGSSARSAFALSSAVGRCQVACAGQREARVDLRGGRDAAERGVRVAAVERAVARVEERDVAGRVAGRGDDLERADPLAGRDLARRAASSRRG